MRASIPLALIGLVLAAGGCGNSESDGASNKNEFIASLCAEFADCCAAAGLPADGAQCRAFYGAFAPAGSYDQASASACLQEIRAQGSAKCDMASGETPSCEKVFASGGTAEPGDACEDDADCAPSDEGETECVSEFVGDASIQQCQVRVPGVEGSSPCVGTVDGNIIFGSGGDETIPTKGYLCNTADGLTCDSQSGACEALGAVGEPCSGGLYACVQTAYCDFGAGVCQQRLALGEACAGDDECQASAYCEPSDSTCAARRAVGEACMTNAECVSDNCTNQTCGGDQSNLALVFLCGSN